MLSLFPVLLLEPEMESQVGWPVFVLVMGGIFVIGWVLNVLAGRALKGKCRRRQSHFVYKK
jgi:hypothetical protein